MNYNSEYAYDDYYNITKRIYYKMAKNLTALN
jgi:hypothetical protein